MLNMVVWLFSVALQPNWGLGRPFFEVSRSRTTRQTPPVGVLNEWSARRWDRYRHNTQQIQNTNIHALSDIRTRDPSKQAASDTRLRRHGHRDQHITSYLSRSAPLWDFTQHWVVILYQRFGTTYRSHFCLKYRTDNFKVCHPRCVCN